MKIFKTNKGKRRDIIGATNWEDIPSSEKPNVQPVGNTKQVLSSDWNDALDKAKQDTGRRFRN